MGNIALSSLLILAAMLIIETDLHAAENGLVVHYTFNKESVSKAKDRSGRNNHGKIVGARPVKENKGYALRFDGNDHIEIPPSKDVNLQEFTFEMWIKTASAPSYILGKRHELHGLKSYNIQVHAEGRKFYCAVLGSDGVSEHWVETRLMKVLDEWFHLAFTSDGKWARFYINGVQETFFPVFELLSGDKDEIALSPDTPLNIGRMNSTSKWVYFKGDLAEWRIYNRALAPDEIRKHYLKGNPALPAGHIRKTNIYGSTYVTAKKIKKVAKPDQQGELYLVKNGKAVSTIVIPVQARYWTKVAAEWLQEYIKKVSEAEIPIVSENEAPTGTLISVGETKLAEKAGIFIDDLKWDGCKLEVKGGNLFLIGRELKDAFQHPDKKISDGNCRAVVTFLEDFCNVRWFLPGPKGEFITRSKDICVPNKFSKKFIPAFAYSVGSYLFGSKGLWIDNITPAAVANNYRKGAPIMSGGHTYYAMVPQKKYYSEHPEYFALIDGERSKEGNHLCTTNPEVRKLMLRYMQDRFDEGYDVATIGQEDSYMRCQCENCEKLDDYRFRGSGTTWLYFQNYVLRDTPCERLFLTHKWVIDELAKSHPDKKVLLMGYAPQAWPSKVIDNWGEKVWVELMNQEPEYIEAWKGKTAGMTGYVYWFNTQLNLGFDVHATPGEVARKIRYLYESGFRGLYHFPEGNLGFQGPVFYTLGKLMGDPYLDHEQLVAEFINGVYGEASPPMKKFFGYLYAVHEKRFPHNLHGKRIPRWIDTQNLYLMMYPPETLARLEKYLLEAEKKADTEQAKGWVHHTREFFDFTKLLTATITAYRIHKKDQSDENWQKMKRSVEDFNKFRLRILNYDEEYANNWFPGHWIFCNWLTGDTQPESPIVYTHWRKRKAEVLARGVEGMAIGYGGGIAGQASGYSYVREPLTLDFSKGQ